MVAGACLTHTLDPAPKHRSLPLATEPKTNSTTDLCQVGVGEGVGRPGGGAWPALGEGKGRSRRSLGWAGKCSWISLAGFCGSERRNRQPACACRTPDQCAAHPQHTHGHTQRSGRSCAQRRAGCRSLCSAAPACRAKGSPSQSADSRWVRGTGGGAAGREKAMEGVRRRGGRVAGPRVGKDGRGGDRGAAV